MTTEMKTPRTNPDYSASAVNLCNPPQLRDLLARLYEAQGNANEIQDRIDASIPADLLRASEQIQKTIVAFNTEIRAAIDNLGSYQDTVNGSYAVKQLRKNVSYDPAMVKQTLPQFAPAIIEETVNKAKMGGLVKGGLITAEQAEQCGKVEETFAYIVK